MKRRSVRRAGRTRFREAADEYGGAFEHGLAKRQTTNKDKAGSEHDGRTSISRKGKRGAHWHTLKVREAAYESNFKREAAHGHDLKVRGGMRGRPRTSFAAEGYEPQSGP
jgi:hypothetical protein